MLIGPKPKFLTPWWAEDNNVYANNDALVLQVNAEGATEQEDARLAQAIVEAVNEKYGVEATLTEAERILSWADTDEQRARQPRVFDGKTEPDVEVGTKLRDKDGDVIERVDRGSWRTIILDGEPVAMRDWTWNPEFDSEYGPYTEVLD